jgi:hypothetical protein
MYVNYINVRMYRYRYFIFSIIRRPRRPTIRCVSMVYQSPIKMNIYKINKNSNKNKQTNKQTNKTKQKKNNLLVLSTSINGICLLQV